MTNIRESCSLGMSQGFAYGKTSDIQELESIGCLSISTNELTAQIPQSLVISSQGDPVMPFYLLHLVAEQGSEV